LEYTAAILDVPKPAPEVVASEFTRPFLEHLQYVLGCPIVEILPLYMNKYQQMVSRKASLYNDVERYLKVLHKSGLRIGLLSDKREVFGLSELSLSGLASLFDSVLFLNSNNSYKPNPDSLLNVERDLGVHPREAIYVGDSVCDIECAKAAGSLSGAARWASVDLEGLDASKADCQFNELGDLLHEIGIY